MDTTDDGWDTMMNINVRAPFRLLRQAAPSLIARKGAVVNVSSVAGLRAFPGIASYAVSKAAVDQLTRVAALDLAPHGVRVNAVNPGVVVTNLHRRGGMDQAKYAEFLEKSRTTHPLGRAGKAGRDRRSDRVSAVAGLGMDDGRHDQRGRGETPDLLSIGPRFQGPRVLGLRLPAS